MKKALIILIALIVFAYAKVKAQQSQQVDPMKVNVTMNIDNLGDGHFEMTKSYNASQWENYTRIYGSNALDMLKREMERSLPSWYLKNWNYKDDGSNHTWTLSFDALGVARINDDGNWVIDLNQKKPDITKISDRNYAMTNTYTSYGVLTQELWKINLPSSASNISQDKDAFGKAIFTFEMSPGHGGMHILFLIAGILLIAAGVIAFVKPELLPWAAKKEQVKPFTVVSAQAAPPAQQSPADPDQKIEKQA
ncbi:MAG: hypothetical protein JSU01_16840 [Bacteroidetes bacterium]|nr:hypothetical protein [Bacteroidota bacterium]